MNQQVGKIEIDINPVVQSLVNDVCNLKIDLFKLRQEVMDLKALLTMAGDSPKEGD